mgnify:CR=1 FL=1
MKFTIITACFNSAATISATLRSVSRQTHADLEHIIIDGGSRDRTLEIVADLGERVSIVVSEPDRGIYDAMNKGLARASGDVVAFLNSDDHYAHEGVLARVTEEFAARQHLDAVFGDVVYFRAGAPEVAVRRYRSGRFRPDRIGWGWVPAHPASFIRKSVYDRFGVFRTDLRIAGDFEFIARSFGRGELAYSHVPEIWARMQLGGASTASLGASLAMNREILQACKDNGIRTNMFMLGSKYPLKVLEYFLK